MPEKIKLGLCWLLLAGIFLSVALVLLGAILYLLKQGQAPTTYASLSLSPQAYTAIRPILQGLLLWDPLALILSGFLVLVFSQILRVLALGCYFLHSREYGLALGSFFIFSVLLYSLLWRS